jgi:predicted nucleic acid-binding Zn ribbon protein
MSTQNQTEPDTTCRVCGQPKEPTHFVCAACFKRLPREYRRQYARLKLWALAWLRENAAKQEEVTPV